MSQDDEIIPADPMNTDSLDLSDDDYVQKKKQRKRIHRPLVDDDVVVEKPKKKKTKGAEKPKKKSKKEAAASDDEDNTDADDFEDDESEEDEGEAHTSDEEFVAPEDEVEDKSTKKHKKVDRYYELKDDNEDEAHVQSVIERENARKLKEQNAELAKKVAALERAAAEKAKTDEISKGIAKSMESAKSAAASTTNGKKRKKDDSDNETDDDGNEPQGLVAVITNKNKKAKETATPAAQPPASKATEKDVKKAADAPKKVDVPVDTLKKTNGVAAATAAKVKKPAVGECFKYKDKLYLLTHYEETTGKSRGADDSDDKWIQKHSLNELSTCLSVESEPSEAWNKLVRKFIEAVPNDPSKFDMDDHRTLPLGMRFDKEAAHRFYFCVIPNSGAPVVLLEHKKYWETHWLADKSTGKPKLEFREYDTKVTGAGKKVISNGKEHGSLSLSLSHLCLCILSVRVKGKRSASPGMYVT